MSKPFIVSWVETNEKSVECNFYKTMGTGAYSVALGSVFTGQFYAAGGAALVGGAAELAYNLSGCADPPPPVPDEGPCWKIDDGAGFFEYIDPSGNWYAVNTKGHTEILSQIIDDRDAPQLRSYCNVRLTDGSVANYVCSHGTQSPEVRLRPIGDATCGGTKPLPDPSPGTPLADPVNVPDPDTGCNWTIQATSAYVDDYGVWHTYYTVTADNDACGGPFAYWSSGDEPPQWVPLPPGPDPPPEPLPPGPTPPPEPEPCPDPCPDIPPPHQLGAATYQLNGVCETVEEGQPQPSYQYPVAGGRYEEVLSSKLDAVAQMLQQHLALKTPTCGPIKPDLWLHWRSIRFESDEYTPNGNRRLSKLFRYRGSSPGDVRRVADHWKDFRWVTGSTVVIHKGSPVGTPQVWARDADEGKRVIRHAFLEAGSDADSVGEWRVTGPTGSRTGVSLEVGLLCVDGCWSATARPGSNGWPEAAVVRPDP